VEVVVVAATAVVVEAEAVAVAVAAEFAQPHRAILRAKKFRPQWDNGFATPLEAMTTKIRLVPLTSRD
jgi:hypothetical protein